MSYYPSIPEASDLPSASQSQIQTNFTTLKSVFGVDHASYGSTYAGFHNQVTFAVVESPSLPNTPQSILYTQSIDSGPTQLVWGDTISTVSNLRHAGAIVAWGNVASNGTAIVTFGCTTSTSGTGQYAVAFTNALPSNQYGVVVTALSGAAIYCAVSSQSTTGFGVNVFTSPNLLSNAAFNFIVVAP